MLCGQHVETTSLSAGVCGLNSSFSCEPGGYSLSLKCLPCVYIYVCVLGKGKGVLWWMKWEWVYFVVGLYFHVDKKKFILRYMFFLTYRSVHVYCDNSFPSEWGFPDNCLFCTLTLELFGSTKNMLSSWESY